MILGIDASTPGSGGAKRHLTELLKNFNPEIHGFSQVKIWGVEVLLDQLPESAFIQKITHPYLNKGFIFRTIWQVFLRDRAYQNQIDILFSPFGTYSGKMDPYVSMSRNMLIFDNKERQRFGMSWLRLKMKLLYFKQKNSFEKAQGIIFLSKYAKAKVAESVNIKNINTTIVHHGVSTAFNSPPKAQVEMAAYSFQNPYRLLYVSTVWVYKHPWNVVEAVSELRKKNYPIHLDFVGNNEQAEAGILLRQKLDILDPDREFVSWHQHVSLNEISQYYKAADGFVFASTCENMPNILIEAMSSGLPIACSSFQPMPEFLRDGGLYFDPTNVSDIEIVLEKMLLDTKLRLEKSKLSYLYSQDYTWKSCADNTFSFLRQVLHKKLNHV
jgi:glycosyltransferase involved in cell wall biosynthesis